MVIQLFFAPHVLLISRSAVHMLLSLLLYHCCTEIFFDEAMWLTQGHNWVAKVSLCYPEPLPNVCHRATSGSFHQNTRMGSCKHQKMKPPRGFAESSKMKAPLDFTTPNMRPQNKTPKSKSFGGLWIPKKLKPPGLYL